MKYATWWIVVRGLSNLITLLSVLCFCVCVFFVFCFCVCVCVGGCSLSLSLCESVSVPIETVLGLSDTQTGQIKTSEKFDYLSEASVTELSLAENKSPDTSVSFSDEYCNHTNDRGYAAFHEELHPDVIRGKWSGLSDKSVQRRITKLSRNKTIEKIALHSCWNR